MDEKWKITLDKEYDVRMLTPLKKKKEDMLKGGDAYSTFVSRLR